MRLTHSQEDKPHSRAVIVPAGHRHVCPKPLFDHKVRRIKANIGEELVCSHIKVIETAGAGLQFAGEPKIVMPRQSESAVSLEITEVLLDGVAVLPLIGVGAGGVAGAGRSYHRINGHHMPMSRRIEIEFDGHVLVSL